VVFVVKEEGVVGSDGDDVKILVIVASVSGLDSFLQKGKITHEKCPGKATKIGSKRTAIRQPIE
jgi:hypothetical protein